MTDDRTRQAFDRLRAQVDDQTDVRAAYRSVVREPRANRWVPAVGLAAVLALVIGGGSIFFGSSDPDGDVADQPTTIPTTTSAEPAAPSSLPAGTDTTGEVVTGPDVTAPATTIPDETSVGRPVPTHRVAGVRADDVLNVRIEPNADAPQIARLAPSYAAVEWTGEEAQAADGATWYRVRLLEPIQLLNLGEPLHGGLPSGWVNASFLEPIDDGLAIDFDQMPCEPGGGIGAFLTEPEGPGNFPADHVYSLQHGVSGDCSRLIVTLGANFTSDRWDIIQTDIRPADAIPATWLANEDRMTIGWSGFVGAREEGMQAATPHGPILVTMDETGQFNVVFTFLVTAPSFRTFPEEGRIVLDYQTFLEPTANTLDALVVAPPPGIVGVSDVIESPIVNIEGWARPFEATLGAELSRDGEPATGRFTGSSIMGEITGSEYAVMTTAGVDAWGYFRFQIDQLEPGDYELFLFSDGGEQPRGSVVTFTVP